MVAKFSKFIIGQWRSDIVGALAEIQVARYRLSLSAESERDLPLALQLSQRIERFSNLCVCAGMLWNILNDEISAPLVWQVVRESPRVANPVLMRELIRLFIQFRKTWPRI